MMRRSALPLVVLLVGTSIASTTDSVDALLRLRGEAFVTAMNAQGDALTAFARDHLGSRVAREGLAARFADSMRADLAELGPIDRHAIQVLDGGRLVFVFCRRTRNGSWQNYQFRVLADDEHRLQLVFRAVAIEPLARPTTAIDGPEAGPWLQRFQAALEEQHPFSGVVVVRRRGKDVYSLVRGIADTSRNVPMSRDTRLGMASGSKMFTAVAILELAQAGKLSLADPLIRHLPRFPNPGFAKRASIHQLLTHTAGAGNYWDDAYERQWDSITELPQMLPFVLPHLEASPPGEFSYSNSGFVLLGLVVEAVAGTSYYDYVQKHVFAPAGMASTGFPIRSDDAAGLALPYDPQFDAGAVKPGVYVPVRLGVRGSSAGGASTTADDLLRFADALRNGVLLDKAHLDLMTRAHVPYGSLESYGYGTILEKKRGVLSFGHGGTARGTQFELKIFPALDTVMVVMSNYNTIAAHELASALDDLIRNAH